MNGRHSGPLAVLPLAWFAAGCVQALPYRWNDSALGLEVYSDFPPLAVQMMFDDGLRAHLAALQRLFGVAALDGLRVCVHDRAKWQLTDDLAAGGWHGGDEIHVMAGWGGPRLDIPSIASKGILLHEFVHALEERAGTALPLWFEEGLCELLSASVLDSDGRLVLLPHAGRERAARNMREHRFWLSLEQLTGFVDEYPEDQRSAARLYAQATSFVGFLAAAERPVDRAGLVAMASLPRAEMQRRFAAWQEALDHTTVSELLRPFLISEHEQVREAAIAAMARAPAEESWWRDVAAMLVDPSRAVRNSARIAALLRPERDEPALRRYRDWSRAADRQLRLSGLLAAAQTGDLDAAVRFCRDLTASDREWAQPLLWLLMVVPAADGGPRRLPAHVLGDPEGTKLQAYAQQLADELATLQSRLEFETASGRYRLRPSR